MNRLLIYFGLICFHTVWAQNSSQSNKANFVSGKDIFGSRVFIENKGQFDNVLRSSEKIKFGLDNGGEQIFFTCTGLNYVLTKTPSLSEWQREEIEKGNSPTIQPTEIYFVKMNWVNANPNIQIEESEKQTNYYTYGSFAYKAFCYKKIIYKNVYNNIDIEYTIPEDKKDGIKYNIILHPGANPNEIKISYTGDVKKIALTREGEIFIKTPLSPIIEHLPLSFYETSEKIKADFVLRNNIIGFNFPEGFDASKTIIIDPFVTLVTSLSTNNYGYDVDYDFAGNLYVYGGITTYKIAKYNPAGILQWTFSGVVAVPAWSSSGNYFYPLIGNFIVDKFSQKCYTGQGEHSAGTRIVRIDVNGIYDNYITTANAAWDECWDFGFKCTGEILGFGGSNFSNSSGSIINPITGSVTPNTFNPGFPTAGQDVANNAIDDNGDVFVIFSSVQTAFLNNKIAKLNPLLNNNIWIQPTLYASLVENDNKAPYVGAGLPVGSSNGFNCLAVNNSFLYYYDGFNLAAYNKLNGVRVGSLTIAGQTVRSMGGIAVDDCNNVYVGGNNLIRSYNFNGTNFNALPSIPTNPTSPNKYIYDLKLDRITNLLYASGSGFIGVFSAVNSLTCSNNQFSVSVNCTGNNNGLAVATVTTNLLSPSISYTWSNLGGTVSVTSNTPALSNSVNLPNGTYTISVQINAPCGPVLVNTLTVNCCSPFSIVPTTTQVSCSNTLSAVSISIVGSGTVVPTVTWTPIPGALAGNSLSATGLPAGTTTISASYGGGCVVTITVNILSAPPPLTFTINNLTGSPSITCINPTINLAAVSNYTFGTISYNWTSPSFTANTSTVGITAPNTLTLTGIDLATGCSFQQTIAISIFTTAPTSTVNPVSQAITCATVTPITFSGTILNPTLNIQMDWYSPLNPLPAGVPIATSNNTISILSGVIPPGVYTLVATNLVNGCKAFKTVTVTSLDAWPTFSIASPTNFSVGCSPLNQTTISIVNPVSTQTPPATCSFTFLPPGYGGTLAPGPYGGNTSTITTIPGTWTVVVIDNSNNCKVLLSVPIIQNTMAPHVLATMALGQMLTCYNPTLLAIGSSSTPNTQINWNQPIPPSLVSTSTIVIGPDSGPNTSTTALSYANYTVIATNTLNACFTTSIVTITQNFKPPISSPTISIGTPTAIYCTAGVNPVVLTTGNSTTTSGMGPLAFPVPLLWEGPSPQGTMTGVSSYSCYVAGVYSLTIKDNANGCVKTGTINILDRTQPPVLVNVVATSTLDCGANSAQISIALTGTTTGTNKYFIFGYPAGAAFSPTSATIPDLNPLLSGTSASLILVSKIGIYSFVVSNTLTGCQASGTVNVVPGALTADFDADQYSGYAPLAVTFTNNSSISLGSATISSVWSFGNGTSQTTTTNLNVNTIYEAPGTYTVMLLSSKGSCLDTAFKVIKVDIPSKLETPNVFTPNGDGSNDVFFLKTANLAEINATIFDRWGTKVYETNSNTGNIAWDGKNLQGKDCAAGVYFYVVTARGNDTKEYKTKGNVTLFR